MTVSPVPEIVLPMPLQANEVDTVTVAVSDSVVLLVASVRLDTDSAALESTVDPSRSRW